MAKKPNKNKMILNNPCKTLGYDSKKRRLERKKLDYALISSVVLSLLPIFFIFLTIFLDKSIPVHWTVIISWIILTFGSIIYFWIKIMAIEIKTVLIWMVLTLLVPALGVIFYLVYYRPYLKAN